jgi:hypothetical protein
MSVDCKFAIRRVDWNLGQHERSRLRLRHAFVVGSLGDSLGISNHKAFIGLVRKTVAED